MQHQQMCQNAWVGSLFTECTEYGRLAERLNWMWSLWDWVLDWTRL